VEHKRPTRYPGAALATVIGVIIKVPVMLSVARREGYPWLVRSRNDLNPRALEAQRPHDSESSVAPNG
jgi:hypothetical protein